MEYRGLRKWRGEVCLNCKTTLDVSEKYCPQCGQLNTLKRPNAWDYLRELFAGTISFDSKIFQSLRLLFWSPGALTRRYMNGERQKYVNPFRFFLSTAIVFSIFILLVTGLDGETSGYALGYKDASYVLADRQEQVFMPVDSVRERFLQTLSPERREALREALQMDLDTIAPLQASSNLQVQGGEVQILGEDQADSDGRITKYHKYIVGTQETRPDRILAHFEDEDTIMNQWTAQLAVFQYQASHDWVSILRQYVPRSPFIVFFTLPVLALCLWLLYVRRSFSYTDHLIFLFHLGAFFFTALTLLLLLSLISSDLAGAAFLTFFALGMPVYTLIAMKRFYAQGWVKSFVKLNILGFLFLTAGMIQVMLLFIVLIYFN